MAPLELSDDLVVDLLRSAWVVEKARARLYEQWARVDPTFAASSERSSTRAEIIGRSLEPRGRAPDAGLVPSHAAWIRDLAGARPLEVAFGDLFLVRLGDWVDAHVTPYLQEGASALRGLGDEERAGVGIPEQPPPPPPFERLATAPPAASSGPRFRFAILSDLHVGSRDGERAARAAVLDINSSGAELCIQLGDLTDHGNKDEFELAAAVLARLEMPWGVVIGNHDVFSYADEAVTGPAHFAAVLGRVPKGTVIEHRGVRFALLDSAELKASPFAPFNLVTGAFMEGRGGAVVRGSLSDVQHDLLAEIAAPSAGPAFVFLHHPPQPFVSFPPIVFGLRDADSQRLHATCDSGNVWAVFAGHTHRNARPRDFDGVPVAEVGVPAGYPFGYGLVDVFDDGFSYRFVQLSDDDLLHDGYAHTTDIQRRYAQGPDEARSFEWSAGAVPKG